MTSTAVLENNREVARELWEKVEKAFPTVGQEAQANSKELAEMLGESVYRTRMALKLFRELDLMSMRSVYAFQKQTVFYARTAERDVAIKAIDEHFAMGRTFSYFKTSTETVAPPMKPQNETVAIVGPDAESTMRTALQAVEEGKVREVTEPEALLEAARQYANRAQAVIDHIGALEGMGITIDRDQLAKAIKVENDPVLDAVSKLLPVFDRVQRTVERLTGEVERLREEVKERRRETGAMASELNTLRDANKRLSERNTNLAGQLAEARTYTHA